ncbi:GrpB family protein [Alkalihalobacillus macyae]|uniref:GrpB family protein n=1 Tax=Guptibacillus hwajinpoensis TaxID=208199 RepID=UPI00273C5C07|nr:GrpB family protein [Alkalihalobacillus macyae]MDP4549595.1 GrpB family protein [Alkalihalobacillus macyae]
MTKPTVQLNEYNAEWESQFDYEKERIIAAIGDKLAGIEHIGSTSIKGLKAKPIIDIMGGIEDLSSTLAIVQPLNEIEFEYVPKPEFTDRRFFRKGSWGKGTCHLHICEIHSTEWIEKIVFRDYLRKHSKVAEEYALLKSELATTYKDDRSTYTQHKEPFIKDIIRKARREFLK